MAYIRTLSNDHFRADVRMKGIVKNKTFPSKKLAQAWAENLEHHIKTIPTLSHTQLLELSDADIHSMGGEELFQQLGVDLFATRNAAKLEAINTLSKKELLQLYPHDIERMGGKALFQQTGKRIPFMRSVMNIYCVGIRKIITVNCNASITGVVSLVTAL